MRLQQKSGLFGLRTVICLSLGIKLAAIWDKQCKPHVDWLGAHAILLGCH